MYAIQLPGQLARSIPAPEWIKEEVLPPLNNTTGTDSDTSSTTISARLDEAHRDQQCLLRQRQLFQQAVDKAVDNLERTKQWYTSNNKQTTQSSYQLTQLQLALDTESTALADLDASWYRRWPALPIPHGPIPSAAEWWRFLSLDLPLAYHAELRRGGADRLHADREWILTRPPHLRPVLMKDIEAKEAKMTTFYKYQIDAMLKAAPSLPLPPYHNSVTRTAVQRSLLGKLRMLYELSQTVNDDIASVVLRARIIQIRREWLRIFPNTPMESVVSPPPPVQTIRDLQTFSVQVHHIYIRYMEQIHQRDRLLAVGNGALVVGPPVSGAKTLLDVDKSIVRLEHDLTKLHATRPILPNVTPADLTSCCICKYPAANIIGVVPHIFEPPTTGSNYAQNNLEAAARVKLQKRQQLVATARPWIGVCAVHNSSFTLSTLFAKHPDRLDAMKAIKKEQKTRKHELPAAGTRGFCMPVTPTIFNPETSDVTRDFGLHLPPNVANDHQTRGSMNFDSNRSGTPLPIGAVICEICCRTVNQRDMQQLVQQQSAFPLNLHDHRIYDHPNSHLTTIYICQDHARTIPEWLANILKEPKQQSRPQMAPDSQYAFGAKLTAAAASTTSSEVPVIPEKTIVELLNWCRELADSSSQVGGSAHVPVPTAAPYFSDAIVMVYSKDHTTETSSGTNASSSVKSSIAAYLRDTNLDTGSMAEIELGLPLPPIFVSASIMKQQQRNSETVPVLMTDDASNSLVVPMKESPVEMKPQTTPPKAMESTQSQPVHGLVDVLAPTPGPVVAVSNVTSTSSPAYPTTAASLTIFATSSSASSSDTSNASTGSANTVYIPTIAAPSASSLSAAPTTTTTESKSVVHSPPPSAPVRTDLRGRVSGFEVQCMNISTGSRIEAFDVSTYFFIDRSLAMKFAHTRARQIFDEMIQNNPDRMEEGEFDESEDGCYSWEDASYGLPEHSIRVTPTEINFNDPNGIILQTTAGEGT